MMPDESDMSVEDLRTWVAALCHVVGAIIMASPDPGAIVGMLEGTLVVTPGDTARRDVIDPWGTAAIPCFWNIRRSCFSSSCLPTRLGNRNRLVLSTSTFGLRLMKLPL